MPEPRKAELLRGLAWNIPAAVGGPVDLIEQVINLGLAGGGTALHKMGAIRADQLPKPLEGSIGTTKWWAKGTPMEESSDPKFVQGQLAGTLATALYGGLANMPLARDSKLRSLFTPEDWFARFGLKDVTPDGRPLGRLPGDFPSDKYAALPRLMSADDTFSAANRAQMDQPGGVPLAQLAPEIRNTPIEGLRIVSPKYAAEPLGATSGGHLDMKNNQAVLRMEDWTGPYSSRRLLNTLHHEGQHGIDALVGAPGQGYGLPDQKLLLRGLAELQKRSPNLGSDMEAMLRNPRHDLYMGNLGEVRARVAGETSPMIAPSTATLDIFNKKERAGYPLNWYTQVYDGADWGHFLLPEYILKGLTKPTFDKAAVDGWAKTRLRDVDLGWFDHRFKLPAP